MTDPLDQPGTALALAEHVAARLQAQLEDFDAKQITLSRDDAVVAFGLINAVIAELKRPAH